MHGLGIDSHLVVKKYQSMEAMLLYLGKCRGCGVDGYLYLEAGWDLVAPGQSRADGGNWGLPWGGWDTRWGTGVSRWGGVARAHCDPPLASRVGDTKHGMMKFREDRSLLGLGLPSGGFHDRYFILNSSCLRLYKEVRVSPLMDTWVPSPALSIIHNPAAAGLPLASALASRYPCSHKTF